MKRKTIKVSQLKIVAEKDGRLFSHTLEGPLTVVESGGGCLSVSRPDGQSLWGYGEDGVPYLGENLPREKPKRRRPVYFSKVFYKDQRGITHVALDNPPHTYADLSDSAVLDTQDVARAAQCSPLTVLRHANAKQLKIHPKSSPRDFYYRKRDVDAWLKRAGPFERGRPRKRVNGSSSAKPVARGREGKQQNDKARTDRGKR